MVERIFIALAKTMVLAGIGIFFYPVIMSFITGNQDWGWMMFMTVPLGVFITLLGMIIVAYNTTAKSQRFMWIGVVLSLLAFVMVFLFNRWLDSFNIPFVFLTTGSLLILLGIWRANPKD